MPPTKLCKSGLIVLALRNPKPPIPFGLHISSHETICTLRRSSLSPHRKALDFLSNFSQTKFGIFKLCMVYKGIACTTNCVKVILPTMERSFNFHPTSLGYAPYQLPLYKLSCLASHVRYLP